MQTADEPKDEVVGAAHQYAMHSTSCRTCSKPGLDLCAEGMKLLQTFHEALNGMLNRKTDA